MYAYVFRKWKREERRIFYSEIFLLATEIYGKNAPKCTEHECTPILSVRYKSPWAWHKFSRAVAEFYYSTLCFLTSVVEPSNNGDENLIKICSGKRAMGVTMMESLRWYIRYPHLHSHRIRVLLARSYIRENFNFSTGFISM